MIETKGIDELFAAFALLQSYQLTIMGGRPLYVSPRDFDVEKKLFGERIKFAGWIDHEIIDQYYQGTKVCVVPSMWPEAFGLVGLEAMKNGKPVVAFDTGGITE